MKTKIINIISTICLLLFCISVGVAQDLLKDTQSGINKAKATTPNRIAKQIAAYKTTTNAKRVSPFKMWDNNLQTEYKNYVDDAVYLKLNDSELNQLIGAKNDYITMEIPVSATKKLQVELMKVNILSDGFKVVTNDGSVIYSDDFPGVFYRGIVKGDVNSVVAFSIFDDRIEGLIADDGGNYTLGKIKNKSNAYILYSDKNLKVENPPFSCETDDAAFDYEVSEYKQLTDTTGGSCVNIYVETDYVIFQEQGNDINNVFTYVVGLFNQVSTLFANEDISLQLSEIFVWTVPDTYIQESSKGAILGVFRNLRPSFNGDLAHLMMGRNINGGIAYLNVLCTPYAYAVSGTLNTNVVPVPNYSYNVDVISHELGHNFGSPHTHACAWNGNNTTIDGCRYEFPNTPNNPCPGPVSVPQEGGTIMSYCFGLVGINFNIGFGLQPGDLIRNRYKAATCKSICGGDCPISLNIVTDYNSNTTANLEVSNNIIASNTIYSNAVIDYDAGVQIDLVEGFHALNDADFRAHIDGCTPSDDKEETVKYDNGMQLRNYPNPFTGQTTIEFVLPKDSPVTLYISDAMGRMVETLVDNQEKQSGTNRITFDGHRYPTGVYYYSIKASEYFGTQKMLIIK